MRIISKFHDYYDSVLSYGMDKNLVYVRKTEEVKTKENFIEDTTFSRYNDFDFTIYVIGFCGKIYLCFKLEDKDDLSNIVYAYNIEDFIKFFKSLKNKDYLDYFLNNKHKRKYCFYNKFNSNHIKGLLEKYNESDKYLKLFFKYNTPIFIKKISGFNYRKNKDILIINPSLKEFEFYKVFEPFTTFQEISMFLGGILGVGQPKLINISNECMIEKKGFDKKLSFRKSPTKRRS